MDKKTQDEWHKTVDALLEKLEAKDREIAELVRERDEYWCVELKKAGSRIKQLEGALKKMLPMLDGLEWQIGYEALNAGRKDHD